LTTKQKKVYSIIEAYIKQNGISPTVREICAMLGDKTPGAVQGILDRLEQKGAIRRQPGTARSIQLLDEEAQLYQQPVYLPEIKKITNRNVDDLLNIYNIVNYQPVPPNMAECPDNLMLISSWDISLEESGIKKGDILFVDTSPELKPNDIAVVFYDGRAYLRRFQKEDENGDLVLTADTDLLGKEVFSKDEVRIIGRLAGRFTKYT